MAHGITRREFAIAAGAASLAGFGLSARARAADTKTLRFIPQSDVQVLDPIWTTAYVTRNHGYMVFDTLFAIDSKFNPHPQMVDGFEVSSDKLNYTFVLRNGLKFHDLQPVRGADCIASIKRWMARDALGQTLATVITDMRGGDDKNFSIHLKEPFPLLIDGLVNYLMAPGTRRRYELPKPLPGLLLVAGRAPLVAGAELAGHVSPRIAALLERRSVRRREAWYAEQMDGREAALEAQSQLRR